MKKTIYYFLILFLVFAGCGDNKKETEARMFEEFKQNMNTYIALMGQAINDFENAKSGDDVAAAYEFCIDIMDKYLKQGEKFQKKYPGFKEWIKKFKTGTIPDEVKHEFQEFNKTSNRLKHAQSNARRYMKHPAVRDSIQKFQDKFGMKPMY